MTHKSMLNILIVVGLLVGPLALGREPAAQAAPDATILYVRPGATGDCSSWVNACELQTALSKAASGDEIWVAQGVYKPTIGIPYASCQEIRAADPTASDGDYLIQNGGNAFQAYCNDMAGTPKEYLSLDSSGNYSQYTAGGASPGTDVRSNYSKVRLLPGTSQVDIGDQTFTVSSGSLMHGSTPVTSMPYGVAMDCKFFSSPTGVAHIDLRGTPFAIDQDETFILGGYYPSGSSTFTDNRQVVSLQGGGYCGWIQPAPYIYEPFNHAGGPILELEQILPERRATFQLKSGVALYGGFDLDSGADTFEERSPEDYPAVLSGDIGVEGENSDNSYHVVTGGGIGPTAILDGFIVTGGHADGSFTEPCGNYCGGGVYNPVGTLDIQNSIFAGNMALAGGGIANGGTLTAANSTFSDNEASSAGGIGNWGNFMLVASTVGPGNNVSAVGGGISNGGEMVISDSTVTGNSGTGTVGGAGIANFDTLVVTNTTISSNFTNVDGGGILLWGGSTLTLTDSTITANVADHNQDGIGSGGGIFFVSPGSFSLKNTIIANNLRGSDCAGGGVWSLTSLGYNMDSDGTCNLFHVTDKPGADPLLGPLADNGGPTFTHALLAGSPAIDAGDPLSCPDADQRGMPRPADGDRDGQAVCDMGAYEFQLKLYFPLTSK